MTSRQAREKLLARTVHLYCDKLVTVRLETNLHGLAAYLTIFNITLITGGDIQENTHCLRTKRTANSVFDDAVIHMLVLRQGCSRVPTHGVTVNSCSEALTRLRFQSARS